MKKNIQSQSKKQPINNKKADQYIRDIPVSDVLTNNYMPYAMSVIKSRALPEIDGFKPAHRKLLYTMYLMKLTNGKKIKCANIVGQTMQFNPHGDSSIYETLVRLSSGNETLLTPFVLSKGNMGKHYSRDMAYAAYRYTEAGLADICNEVFDGLDKNAVDMIDNYDGTKKEPALLPVSFPNILATPTLGIAVGMASNICSFNLGELCNATVKHIKDKKADLLDIMPAPDFSTGGQILYDEDEIKRIYQTGKGSVRIRSKYVVHPKEREIEITEIPYSTTSEAIVEGVIDLCKAGRIKEIDNIRDDTDKEGMTITIEYKRRVNPDALMNRLFALTPLEDNYSCNFTILIEGNPVVCGVYEILDKWVEYRKSCIRRSCTYDLGVNQDKLHLLEGLEKILLNIDKAFRIIKNTEKDSDVIPNLMSSFKIDRIQAEYIAEIKLRNVNREYILKRTKDIEKLKKDIERLQRVIASDKEIEKIIIKKLQSIASDSRYAKARKTSILREFTVAHDELSESGGGQNVDEPEKIFITNNGYISIGQRAKMVEGDKVSFEGYADDSTDILILTNKCNLYKSKFAAIKKMPTSDYGIFAKNIAQAEPDEQINFVTATKDYEGWLFIVFENGKAAKIPLKSYETKTNRKKLVNAIDNTSVPIGIYHLKEDMDFEITLSNNKKKIVNSKTVSEKASRTTKGVQFIRLSAQNAVVSVDIVSQKTN